MNKTACLPLYLLFLTIPLSSGCVMQDSDVASKVLNNVENYEEVSKKMYLPASIDEYDIWTSICILKEIDQITPEIYNIKVDSSQCDDKKFNELQETTDINGFNVYIQLSAIKARVMVINNLYTTLKEIYANENDFDAKICDLSSMLPLIEKFGSSMRIIGGSSYNCLESYNNSDFCVASISSGYGSVSETLSNEIDFDKHFVESCKQYVERVGPDNLFETMKKDPNIAEYKIDLNEQDCCLRFKTIYKKVYGKSLKQISDKFGRFYLSSVFYQLNRVEEDLEDEIRNQIMADAGLINTPDVYATFQ